MKRNRLVIPTWSLPGLPWFTQRTARATRITTRTSRTAPTAATISCKSSGDWRQQRRFYSTTQLTYNDKADKDDAADDIDDADDHKKAVITGTIPRGGKGVLVGQWASVHRTFTSNDVQTFGRLVGDLNPLHSNHPKPSSNSNKAPNDQPQQREEEEEEDDDLWKNHPLLVLQQQEQQQHDGIHNPATTTTTTTTELVHGMLVASLFSCIFGTLAPGAVYLKQSLQFRRPVFVGRPVVATTTVTRIRTPPRRGGGGGIVVTCQTSVTHPNKNNSHIDNDNNHNDETNQRVEYVSGEADVWLVRGYQDPAEENATEAADDNHSHNTR
ncbi:hypothetical protein ACA910_007250 [Epithemia clementina (nom. ined.)]